MRFFFVYYLMLCSQVAVVTSEKNNQANCRPWWLEESQNLFQSCFFSFAFNGFSPRVINERTEDNVRKPSACVFCQYHFRDFSPGFILLKFQGEIPRNKIRCRFPIGNFNFPIFHTLLFKDLNML